MEKAKKLLDEIRVLTEMNNRLRKEKLARGDAFNVFHELDMDTDEVRMHSAFIAMLLNPRASHGQKDKFLKLFVEMLEEHSSRRPMKMNTKMSSAYLEHYIGPVTADRGGRIDIYITDKADYRIVIENKINAGDQPKQMKRYWNFLEDKCRNDADKYRLVYLTKYGDVPSKDSLDGLSEDQYICLSYKSDIIPWLEKCAICAIQLPLLRETLNQYIDLIKQITNTDMANENEMLEIMSKEEYLEAVYEISGKINDMIDNIMNNILHPQLEEIAAERGLELEFSEGPGWMTESWCSWAFINPNWKDFCMRMEFERRGLGNLIIGFHTKKGIKREQVAYWDELWERTTTIGKDNSNGWIYKPFPVYSEWNNPRSLKAITDGHTMKEHIAKQIDEFMSYADGLVL